VAADLKMLGIRRLEAPFVVDVPDVFTQAFVIEPRVPPT